MGRLFSFVPCSNYIGSCGYRTPLQCFSESKFSKGEKAKKRGESEGEEVEKGKKDMNT